MTSPYGLHFGGSQWPWALDGDEGGNWFALHDASGRYVSDACVEGYVAQWREAADALRNGRDFRAKRLSVQFVDGEATRGREIRFCSPRNTLGGVATLPAAKAVELADIIDAALAAKVGP